MQPHSIEPLQEEEGRPEPNWKRRILIAAACLLGLLIVCWWMVSSEMFLRGVVLKKIGQAIHAEISFESADWSPRRSVVLRGVGLKAVGQEPCLEAKEITVNFELGELLAGKINLDDITLVEPVVSVYMDTEGNTNLDPFFDKSGKPGKPARVEIGRFVLQRGVLNFHRQFHSGNEERMTIRHLDMRGENIGNKHAGKLNITAGVQYALRQAEDEVVDKLEGTLSLECGQELGLNWFPESITARAKVLINETSGQFAFANGLVANLESRLTPTELENFQINFQHEGNPIGNLLLSGPIDFENGAAELKMAVNGIERRVLNFVGQPHALEFHEIVLSSTNRLAISALGRQIQLQGSVIGTPIKTSLGRVSFPSVDLLEAHYDFTMDLEGKRAVFDALRIRAVQQDEEFLKGQINQPMTLVWGGDSIEAPDSRFELAVANTNVADWQPWLGRYAKSGAVKARAEIRVKNNGREVHVDSSGSISGFQLPVNGKVIKAGDFNLNATGQIIDFNKLEFTQFKAEVGRPDKVFFKYEGRPVVNLKTKAVMDTNGKFEGEVPILLSWFPQESISCETGRVTYNGTLTAKLNQPHKQTVTGTMHWENVNGVIKAHKLDRLAGTADLDLELKEGHQLRINRFVTDATVGGQPLFSKISLRGLWNLRDGLVDLGEVVINGLDLSLLKFTVPMKGVSAGMLDVRLETLGHEPASKTVAKKVVANIRKGVVAGWPMDLNLDGSGDVEMTWLGKGDFRMRGSTFDLNLLSKGDASRSDAQLKGDVLFNKSTGEIQVDLKSSHWDYPFLNSMLMKRLGAVEILDAKIIQVEPISFKSDGEGSFEIQGPIKVERLRLKDPEGLLPKGQLAANLIMDVVFTLNQKEWSINDCNTAASFFWENRNAGHVILKGNYRPQLSAGAFDVTVKDVDPHIVSLLPRRWTAGAQMRNGRISKLLVEGKIEDQKLTASLNAELKGAEILVKNDSWPAGAMDIKYDLKDAIYSFDGGQWAFKAGVNKLNVNRDGVEVASFDMMLSVKDSAKTFSIKSLDLKSPFTSLGLKKWLPNQHVKAGRLTINESELRLDPKGNGHFNGNIKLSKFTFPSDMQNGKPALLDASFIIDAEGTNNVFSIKRFTANLPRTSKAKNVGTISGRIDLSDLRAPSGRIQLKSDALDITPLSAFLKSADAKTKDQATAKPASPKTDLPAVTVHEQQLSSGGFAFRQFAVDLDVGKIYWSDLNATDVKGEIQLSGREYLFRPLEFKLLDTPAMLEGRYRPQYNGRTQYDLKFFCDRLPISPLVRHFNAEDRHQWGLLSANISARASASKGPEFQRSLKINGIDRETPAFMKLTEANWGSKEYGFFVKLIASSLRVPELLDSNFDTAQLNLTVDKGRAVYELEVGGPLMNARIEGASDLAEDWLDSVVQEDIDIELAPKLAKEFQPAGIKFIGNDFMRLPTFISLNGAVRRPDVDVDELAVGIILARNFSALPGNILRKIPIPFLNEPKNPDGTKKMNLLNPFDLLRLVIPDGDER